MTDDFLAGVMLPDDDIVGATDDPNDKTGDFYLPDDPLDTPIDDLDIPLGLLDDDDDELLDDE